MDYLLKPISSKRLEMAMQKVRVQQKPTPKAETFRADSQIFMKDGDKCWLVYIRDIWLFEIVGNYTRVYFGEEKPLIYKSLNQIETKLPEDTFFRINRQQIVNILCVQKIEPWFKQTFKLLLTSGMEVEVSRRQSVKLKERLSF